MLFVLFVIFGFGLVICEPISLNYHERIGIKQAAAIRALEDAPASNIQKLIYQGSKVRLGQYPYFGGLVISLKHGETSCCGSSLLTETRLVTAAHCWSDGKKQAFQFEVVLGSTTLFHNGTRIITNDVQMHKRYNPTLIHNDIAMIRIKNKDNIFNDNIRPIALPSGRRRDRKTFAGTLARTAGFGDTDCPKETKHTLQHVSLEVITNSNCSHNFGDEIIESILCTIGSGGRNVCSGDSGGPLVITRGGKDVLIGIVSFGHEYCDQDLVAAFTRVTSFVRWIRARL